MKGVQEGGWPRLVLSGPHGGHHFTSKKVQVCVPPAKGGGLRGLSRFITIIGCKSLPKTMKFPEWWLFYDSLRVPLT